MITSLLNFLNTKEFSSINPLEEVKGLSIYAYNFQSELFNLLSTILVFNSLVFENI